MQLLSNTILFVRVTISAVQVSDQARTPPTFKQDNTTFVNACGTDVLSPAADLLCRKKRDPLDRRSYSPQSRPVEFFAIKLLAPWRSLTSFYHCSFSRLVPSDFGGSSKSAWLREYSDQPQYIRHIESIAPLLKSDVPSRPSTKNVPASDTIQRPNDNLPTKQRARPSQKREGALTTCTAAMVEHQSLP